jgi:hypothetical protein
VAIKKGKKGKYDRPQLTRRMQLFLDVARDRSMLGKSMALKDIAQECGLDQARPSKWMRTPAFREALSLLLRDVHAPLIEASIASLLQLAIRGNLHAFDKVMSWLERLGRIATRPPADMQASADVERVEVVNGL